MRSVDCGWWLGMLSSAQIGENMCCAIAFIKKLNLKSDIFFFEKSCNNFDFYFNHLCIFVCAFCTNGHCRWKSKSHAIVRPGLKADDTLMRTILFKSSFFYFAQRMPEHPFVRAGAGRKLQTSASRLLSAATTNKFLSPAVCEAKRRLRPGPLFSLAALIDKSFIDLSVCKAKETYSNYISFFTWVAQKHRGKKMHAKVGRNKKKKKQKTWEEA